MSVSRCQQALYIGCTYILETCMYTFIPCGQHSRCPDVTVNPVRTLAAVVAVIFINPPSLNDIIGAAVYPLPLLVIAITVIAPEATVAVAIAPVPVP